MLIFLFTLKFCHFISFSFKPSHISLLCVCVCVCARACTCVHFYPKSALISNPVFFSTFPTVRFCRGETKDISSTSWQLPNNFLAINVQQLSSPGQYKFLPFSRNCCVLPSLPITKNTTWLIELTVCLFFFFFLLEDFNKWIRSALCLLRVYIFWCPAWQQAGSFSWKNMGFGSSQPLVYLLFFFLSY